MRKALTIIIGAVRHTGVPKRQDCRSSATKQNITSARSAILQ